MVEPRGTLPAELTAFTAVTRAWSGVFITVQDIQTACLNREYDDMPSEADLDAAVKKFNEAVAECKRVRKPLSEADNG